MKASKQLGLALGVAILAGLALFSSPASAQPKQACAEDIKKLCKDVKSGGGRVYDCLKQHEANLSDDCKKQVQGTGKQRFGGGGAACSSDVEKFCKGMEQGGGRISNCLKEHEKDLSAECKAAMSRGGQRKGQDPSKKN